jgi:hypothetical protein
MESTKLTPHAASRKMCHRVIPVTAVHLPPAPLFEVTAERAAAQRLTARQCARNGKKMEATDDDRTRDWICDCCLDYNYTFAGDRSPDFFLGTGRAH